MGFRLYPGPSFISSLPDLSHSSSGGMTATAFHQPDLSFLCPSPVLAQNPTSNAASTRLRISSTSANQQVPPFSANNLPNCRRFRRASQPSTLVASPSSHGSGGCFRTPAFTCDIAAKPFLFPWQHRNPNPGFKFLLGPKPVFKLLLGLAQHTLVITFTLYPSPTQPNASTPSTFPLSMSIINVGLNIATTSSFIYPVTLLPTLTDDFLAAGYLSSRSDSNLMFSLTPLARSHLMEKSTTLKIPSKCNPLQSTLGFESLFTFPWLYSLTILLLDVYDSILELLSDSSWISYYRSYSIHFRPPPPSLSFYPLPKPNPALVRLVYMNYFLWNCRFVFCKLPLSLVTITTLEPFPSFFSPWQVYCCLYGMKPAFGLEEFDTDDIFSVFFKGSTLFSAADFKIVKSALAAVSITGNSPLLVFLTSHSSLSLLKLHLVEIRGPLHSMCCFCLIVATILCSYASCIRLVALMLILPLVKHSSFQGE